MIVGPVFRGDEHHDLRQAQQRQVGRGAAIVIAEARSRWIAAETLLDVRTPLGIAVRELHPDNDLIDDGVEYLAAIWRLTHDRLEPRMAFDAEDTVQADVEDWLRWLAQWVKRECPDGVLRALLSCAYEPDARSLAQHGYLVQWLRDRLSDAYSVRTP